MFISKILKLKGYINLLDFVYFLLGFVSITTVDKELSGSSLIFDNYSSKNSNPYSESIGTLLEIEDRNSCIAALQHLLLSTLSFVRKLNLKKAQQIKLD